MVGHRQKMRRQDQESEQRPRGGDSAGRPESCLALTLLRLWSEGSLSAMALQRLAHAAHTDGLAHPQLAELSCLGAWGRQPSHCHRDLTAKLLKEVNIAEAVRVQVPCLDSKLEPPYTDQGQCSMMLPHLTLASLAAEYPEQLHAMMGLDSVDAFWHKMLPGDPRLVGNPVLAVDRSKVVAMWIHGDGVEFSTDSLLTLSTGSCLTVQGSMDSSLFCAAWPKSATADVKKHAGGTWPVIFKMLAWSFVAMWEGTHPLVDHNGLAFEDGSAMHLLAGKPLCPSGWRFLVWQLVGDLEYYANVLKLPHWNKDEFCWWCNGSKSNPGRNVYDFRDNPGWAMHSVPDMLASAPSVHPFFTEIPGCAPALRPAHDMLHSVEFGLTSRLVGSVLHCWAFPADGPATRAPARISEVWQQVKQAYSDLAVEERLNNLTVGMFSNAERPWAASPELKPHAAELRHLVPALAVVARLRRDGSEVAGHICIALESLAGFYLVCEGQDMFMEPAAAEAAFQHMKVCLRGYAWLHLQYEDTVRFPLFPKLHHCYHLAWFCRWQNPRSNWTYKNEDWVGKIATIAHSCSHGMKTVKLTHSLVEKYRIMLHLRMVRSIHDD